MIVTIQDCRACGFCIKDGVRKWFDAHGMDFRDFVKNGIEAEVLRELNDEFALRAIEKAEERHGR